ncbi:MAG: hypothetical protein NC132_04600 [Corallococcus sp.]|nr:hypothetical protein [Corallococcus sp.]MCM1359666.1 hypothetical protein [Corallococcus sp.]MCM1395375.1 hypothetical protein [Corallococcus sp.]
MQSTKQLLKDILLKKAKGFSFKEKTEEYNVVNGEAVLAKKRIVTKNVHPDVTAVKALLQLDDGMQDVSAMTDEQLQVEKLRLMQLLNICDSAESSQSPAAEPDN